MIQEAPSQLLWTIPEAAERLRIGRTTLYLLLQQGALKPTRIGKLVRISEDELRGWVARQQAASAGQSSAN